jgi:mannose-1-phosphate guanylyltransferase
MHRKPTRERRWGVILAGGEGVRLRSLTRLVSGDDRPKQFCPLLGGRTLLNQTRRRIQRSISQRRTLFVLLRAHERFYTQELWRVPPAQTVIQPANRGTLPAILAGLTHIVRDDQRGPEAVVAIFPSDHYYADEQQFRAGVELAFGMAETNPESVVLLGAPAKHAEIGYGWIEAEAALSSHSGDGLLRVKRFWEKPSLPVARDLLDRGCVWNTFVMVGRIQAFLDMVRRGAPELYQAFEPMRAPGSPQTDEEVMRAAYDGIESADFSQSILSATPERLRVLCLGDVGWSDLGEPGRVMGVLEETGLEHGWATLWHRESAAVAGAF